MNARKAFLAGGLLLAGVVGVMSSGDGAPSAPPAAAPVALVGDARVGKETFTEYCSICHGVGAIGFIGPHIGGINWTVPGLHAIVRGGVGGYGGMPAFNPNAVTDQMIADIAAYLASLPPAGSDRASTAAPTVEPTVAAAPSPAAPAAVAAAPTAPAQSIAPVAPLAAATPRATPAGGDPLHGHQVYTANCAACHGAAAQGGVGPSLRGEKQRKDLAAAIAWIKNPKLPMPKLYPDTLSERDVDDVAAYVESL